MGKKWPCFNLFFSSNIGQEKLFYDILERKKGFLRYKNKKFNSRKIYIFFQAIQASKMSFTIFQNEKSPFQATKTRSSKSRKNDIFPKWLTHSFGPKMAIFQLFFYAIQAREVSFKKFQNKKAPLYAIKTRNSESRKTEIFAKGLTSGIGEKTPF